jgi:hypothetical protein
MPPKNGKTAQTINKAETLGFEFNKQRKTRNNRKYIKRNVLIVVLTILRIWEK